MSRNTCREKEDFPWSLKYHNSYPIPIFKCTAYHEPNINQFNSKNGEKNPSRAESKANCPTNNSGSRHKTNYLARDILEPSSASSSFSLSCPSLNTYWGHLVPIPISNAKGSFRGLSGTTANDKLLGIKAGENRDIREWV